MIVFVMVFLIGAFGMNFPIFSSTMAVEFGRGAGEYGLLSSILAIGSLDGCAARRPPRARTHPRHHPGHRVLRRRHAHRGAHAHLLDVRGLDDPHRPRRRHHPDDRQRLRADHDRARTARPRDGAVHGDPRRRHPDRRADRGRGRRRPGPALGARHRGGRRRGGGAHRRRLAGVLTGNAGGEASAVRLATVVRFADAPTAALSAIETQSLPVAAIRLASIANERLVPADFSEEVALTSPIPLPKLSARSPRVVRASRVRASHASPSHARASQRPSAAHPTASGRRPRASTQPAPAALSPSRDDANRRYHAARTDDLRHFTEHAARWPLRSRRGRASRRRPW